ncbi:DNA polymerase III subunit tau [Brevundimonas diminuta]|uniref:DNA polymerase III subunit gamma/tau n=1 Tax=Brevundimonas diminuta TaxID=293 RepID=UPI000B4E64C3|nr:DNA polymerase III subunit gamma/tau [Brevundimonas diminuta]MBD3819283.1 DNA polymerase III subunit gamma/tau [Brevundimonas diminuta]OWR21206.1 DNA polymerase III subunit gamma/tau [Brevundimonas diminuta]WQE45406.1 DNA polymerase III subunit gamma/tau [Brevundimonas diminuta]SPU44714.1 DNA polymerase III subunit tau [Brevundimonas diminuta]SUW14619.1 DNA polymerase III subunit tau [Brevundimonas diminuta]
MSDADHSLDGPPWEEDAPEVEERDPNTDDMFGAPAPVAAAEPAPEPKAEPAPAPAPKPFEAPPAEGEAYTVLARKYRPRAFEDLIGQEAMVRTLTNAFATGRIAHAFMLTGVRGVGKTTTARLLARALNNETETIDKPSLALSPTGRHDAAIMAGQHMDVMEMDAASHTGVNDIRDILESVRYAPVEARYKVYVLDEVHMLSTQAFNALLKTLEEPPPHAKFIFATTEIRKVPVTILSRCQRFDLRRVEPEVLVGHLGRVAEREGMKIEQEALALISRAAEGSVRDGLSLLDQALVQAERGAVVETATVRDMLGLADRTQTIALFEQTMAGKTAEALTTFRTLYGYGADPVQVANDLLEHCHAASVAKMLGPNATRLPGDQAQKLAALGAAISAGTLSRTWQMLLKALDEVRRAPNPADAVEMAIVRLAYAADLPGPEEALKAIQSGGVPGGGAGGPRGGGSGGGGGGASAMLAARPMAAPALPDPQSFEAVVALIGEKREITLQMDVERYVRVVSFRPGAITYEPAEGSPHDLARRLAGRLKEWTGRTWLIAANGQGGGETLIEVEKKARAARRAAVEADPFVVSIMQAFPGAEIKEIVTLAPAVEMPAIPDDGEAGDDD